MVGPKVNVGGLAVLQERFNEFKWVMIIEKLDGGKKYKVINDIKKDPIIVFKHKLMNYPDINTIEPYSDGKMKLSNNDVIEIYELK